MEAVVEEKPKDVAALVELEGEPVDYKCHCDQSGDL